MCSLFFISWSEEQIPVANYVNKLSLRQTFKFYLRLNRKQMLFLSPILDCCHTKAIIQIQAKWTKKN